MASTYTSRPRGTKGASSLPTSSPLALRSPRAWKGSTAPMFHVPHHSFISPNMRLGARGPSEASGAPGVGTTVWQGTEWQAGSRGAAKRGVGRGAKVEGQGSKGRGKHGRRGAQRRSGNGCQGRWGGWSGRGGVSSVAGQGVWAEGGHTRLRAQGTHYQAALSAAGPAGAHSQNEGLPAAPPWHSELTPSHSAVRADGKDTRKQHNSTTKINTRVFNQ